MKVLGLITEYNPFHFGHKYHLEESLKLTNSSHSIAVMSGSFVQKGEIYTNTLVKYKYCWPDNISDGTAILFIYSLSFESHYL